MIEPNVVDLSWIATCNSQDAEEALRVLDEVLVEFDRGNSPIAIRPRCNTRGGFRPQQAQHDNLVRWRQDVVLMLTRRRVVESSRYFESLGPKGECFTVEAAESIVRRARELFDARTRGEALTGVLSCSPMSTVPAPLAWLEEIPTDILAEARDVLEAINREIVLGKSPIRIFPFPSEYEHHTPPIGQEERLKALRADVAEMLVRRGVLQRQQGEYVGGPYARDADRGDWLVMEADPAAVRHALEQFREEGRRREQYSRLPANQRSSLPTPRWVGLPAGNVTNYYGPTSIVSSTGDHNMIAVTVGGSDLKVIAKLLDELEKSIDKLGLDPGAKQELESEVATIEAQARSPKPKANIIKIALSGLGRILAGAAVREAAQPLIHQIAQILPHLGG